jgi:hypothetical protein
MADASKSVSYYGNNKWSIDSAELEMEERETEADKSHSRCNFGRLCATAYSSFAV